MAAPTEETQQAILNELILIGGILEDLRSQAGLSSAGVSTEGQTDTLLRANAGNGGSASGGSSSTGTPQTTGQIVWDQTKTATGQIANVLFNRGAYTTGASVELQAERLGKEATARTFGAVADSKLGTNIFQNAGLLSAQYLNRDLLRQQEVLGNATAITQAQLSDPTLLGLKVSDDAIRSIYRQNKFNEQLKSDRLVQVGNAIDAEEGTVESQVKSALGNLTSGAGVSDIIRQNNEENTNNIRDIRNAVTQFTGNQ